MPASFLCTARIWLKNGAQRIVIELMERGWITHLATNGAG